MNIPFIYEYVAGSASDEGCRYFWKWRKNGIITGHYSESNLFIYFFFVEIFNILLRKLLNEVKDNFLNQSGDIDDHLELYDLGEIRGADKR